MEYPAQNYKILITGKNSFIGNDFIKFSYYNYVDEVSLLEFQPEQIDFKGYNIILHLAAIVHQSAEISEDEYFRVNRDLTVRLAQLAKAGGVKQFVFISTVKVYGETHTSVLNEYSECMPVDNYGKSKLDAENRILALSDQSFIVTIIRPALVYGRGVKANMHKLIILVDRCRILPFGNIENKRNFIYSENLIALIDRAIELRASGVFIAIDEKSVSTTELVRLISKALGKDTYLFRMPKCILKTARLFFPVFISRLFDSMEFENSITMQRLNLQLPFSTEEGIKRTVESVLQRG